MAVLDVVPFGKMPVAGYQFNHLQAHPWCPGGQTTPFYPCRCQGLGHQLGKNTAIALLTLGGAVLAEVEPLPLDLDERLPRLVATVGGGLERSFPHGSTSFQSERGSSTPFPLTYGPRCRPSAGIL